MITILHGDNTVASRDQMVKLKESAKTRGYEIITVDGKKSSFEQITLVSQTQTLLGEAAVFVEEYFGNKKNIEQRAKGKGQKEKSIGYEMLSGTVVFWESKELSQSLINSLPKKWKTQNFSISRKTFQFLDAIMPGNTKKALMLLNEVIQTDTEYVVLPTLAWHVRMLIWAKQNPQSLEGQTWKKQKLIQQAQRFSAGQLLDLHNSLYKLDRAQKTGTLEIPLSHALDLMVFNL